MIPRRPARYMARRIRERAFLFLSLLATLFGLTWLGLILFALL